MEEQQQSVSNCYVFKSRLQEYAQKAGLTTPIYHTIKEGPSHQPVFRSTVVINEESYDSLTGFLNRKAAEQSAAEVALVEIAKSGATDKSVSHPVHETGLCKNLLQEYAQKMNYAIPSYVCAKDEKKGRESLFSCTVDIGGIKYIGAAAKTKKEAELKAAKTALLAIRMSGPEANGKPESPDPESVYTVLPTKRKEPEPAIMEMEKVKTNKRKKFRFKRRRRKGETTQGEVVEVKTNGVSCDDEVKLNGESGLVRFENPGEVRSNGESGLVWFQNPSEVKLEGESGLVRFENPSEVKLEGESGLVRFENPGEVRSNGESGLVWFENLSEVKLEGESGLVRFENPGEVRSNRESGLVRFENPSEVKLEGESGLVRFENPGEVRSNGESGLVWFENLSEVKLEGESGLVRFENPGEVRSNRESGLVRFENPSEVKLEGESDLVWYE